MDHSAALLESARALAVDGWTAEAVRALRDAGVETLLLKGPAIASWLYDRGEPRPYSDADLLVARAQLPAAEATLSGLGYQPVYSEEQQRTELPSGPHAESWVRPRDLALIDLHHTLPADIENDELVWPVLSDRAARLEVGGTDVRVLDLPSRAVMVAIHAAHHGPDVPMPLEDLRRAVARLPAPLWEDAALVAESILALGPFADGLRLLPEGAALAERMRLPPGAAVQPRDPGDLGAGFERLRAARGTRERAALIGRELVPSRAFMHWWAPWSRSSRAHLLAARAYRLAWLARHAPPGWLAWRRERG